MRKIVCWVMSFIFVLGIFFSAPIVIEVSAAEVSTTTDHYCIEGTPAITEASYDLLNEVYLEKYPQLALEYSFGSEKDRLFLKDVAEKITEGKTTDKEKVDAIAKWVSKNIQYQLEDTPDVGKFAIDVFHLKKAACLGAAQFVVQTTRLLGIPSVLAAGTIGDMETEYTFFNREFNHAWAMVYVEDDWYLYDTVNGVLEGENNREVISKKYFFDMLDGVSPYAPEYIEHINFIKTEEGYYYSPSAFYIDGKFMSYTNGINTSDYYNSDCVSGCGIILNNWVPYLFEIFCLNEVTGVGDSLEYVDVPERKDEMLRGQLYTDGWVSHSPTQYYYMKENGIRVSNSLKYKDDTLYYFTRNSGIEVPGESTDYTFTHGLLTFKKGDTFSLGEQDWIDYARENGMDIVTYDNRTPETATVSENGEITFIEDGYVFINVICQYPEEEGGGYSSFPYEFHVESDERETHYFTEEKIIKKATCQSEGQKKICCMFCDEEITKTIPVTNEHKIIVVGKKAATTKEMGYTGDKVCSVCKTVIEKGKKTLKLTVVLATPKVATQNTTKGITITWNKIENAEKYVVYQRVYNAKTKQYSGWKAIKTTIGLTYTDTTVKLGTTYSYTVKALNGSIASKYTATKGLKYNVTPTVKVANVSNGVQVSWSTAANATGYTVYSSTYNAKTKKWSGWTNRGTTKANVTSWVDKKATKSGVYYKYTVRAINGKIASSYNKSGASTLFLAQPIVKIANNASGIKVSWNKITGATGYTVYRMEYNAKTKKWSKWSKMGTAKADKKSWTDKSAKMGVQYKYTVRAVNGKTASTYKASDSVKG